MLRYLVDGGRSAVFRGASFALAVSEETKDRALCCDDDAGRQGPRFTTAGFSLGAAISDGPVIGSGSVPPPG